jgi:acetyltransferase-like isoleucine patch superfamily enzyme
MKPAMTPQQARLSDGRTSPLGLYREFSVGDSSWGFLALYEVVTLLTAQLPGLPGFALRACLYPYLFGRTGNRPALGRGLVVRNPRSMTLGEKVMVDDYAVLDARGTAAHISLGDHVSVGRFTTIAAKGGRIELGRGANIGSYCRLATQSRITVGESVLVAAYCYIGPGNHLPADDSTPLIAREMEMKGGVTIGEHAWIGAHSTILDGVTIGAGAIVGAHSLVRADVPAGAVVAGVPARIIRTADSVSL